MAVGFLRDGVVGDIDLRLFDVGEARVVFRDDESVGGDFVEAQVFVAFDDFNC